MHFHPVILVLSWNVYNTTSAYFAVTCNYYHLLLVSVNSTNLCWALYLSSQHDATHSCSSGACSYWLIANTWHHSVSQYLLHVLMLSSKPATMLLLLIDSTDRQMDTRLSTVPAAHTMRAASINMKQAIVCLTSQTPSNHSRPSPVKCYLFLFHHPPSFTAR